MLRTITPAGAAPVSLDEAKRHLRVDFGDDDALIASLIDAATLRAQALTQRRFVTQTVEWVRTGWEGGRLRLPVAPVMKDGVDSIAYADLMTGATATLDPSRYVVRTRGPSVEIIPALGAVWPLVLEAASEPVLVRFTVGAAPADVPANVKAAIQMILAHLYENRQAVVSDGRAAPVELPQGAEALLMSELW
jgi:uncharacterized phiE125 gp8 family phage protein